MSARPWYREPMVWLVAALPLASIVAGFALLGIASGERATDAAPERVRRMAQVQERDLAPDQRALALGLRGTLRQGDDGRLELQLAGRGDRPARLQLALVHPAEAGLDHHLTLQRQGDRWYAAGRIAPGQAWQLQLTPPDAAWRLVGRWPADGPGSDLGPALAPE